MNSICKIQEIKRLLKRESHWLNHQKRNAFTLLEVMLALAILALLTAALFTVVQGSLKATSELMEKQKRAAQIAGFLQLWEQIFYRLPMNAVLKSGISDSSNAYLPFFTIQNAPQIFPWIGDLPTFTLAIRVRAEGGFNILILKYNERKKYSSDQSFADIDKLSGFPLLTNLSNVKWRFFDARNGWVEQWSNNSFWPKAIELSFSIMGDSESVRSVILLPQLSHVSPPLFQVQNGS